MTRALFATRHPYLAAALLFFATLAIFLVWGAVVAMRELPVMALYPLALGTLALLCAGLMLHTGWSSEIGLRPAYDQRYLWLFVLAFVPVLGNLAGGITVSDPGQLLGFAGLALISGVVEEIVFRGLILRALLPTGRLRAAVISAVLFGAMHSLNVLSISSPAYAALQVAYATAIGFGYAALVIFTGTLWPLVMAHALTNFAGFIAAGGAGGNGPVATGEMVLATVYIVLFSVYGWYVLRLARMGAARPVSS
jgi:membrane protease YdiL (CAAX protease family)